MHASDPTITIPFQGVERRKLWNEDTRTLKNGSSWKGVHFIINKNQVGSAYNKPGVLQKLKHDCQAAEFGIIRRPKNTSCQGVEGMQNAGSLQLMAARLITQLLSTNKISTGIIFAQRQFHWQLLRLAAVIWPLASTYHQTQHIAAVYH